MQITRQPDMINKIISEEPETETWINQEYSEQDIGKELRNLANRIAHVGEGIPGDAYKAPRKWEIAPITKIANRIKEGQAIPGK